MKGLFLVAFAPLALALGFGILFMGIFGVGIIGQGVCRTTQGKSFLPPATRPTPTGLDNLMVHYLTSPAGRKAARRHLLIHERGGKLAQH
jgi:hypothetical protein